MYLLKSAERNLVVETLPNQLKLAVIRSDGANAPIISISVAAGHYHETTQSYGFSHLLEHMIFHRSQNFDSSIALEKHVSKHSGYINGWTHACHTNFHLSCSSDGFIKAAQILIDKVAHPTFDSQDIKTEIAAIDEEYHLKIEDPIRGLFSVKKAIANPAHPFHRFTVGNLNTLTQTSIDMLQQQLLEHHQRYFHSGNIAVCVKLPKSGDYQETLTHIKHALCEHIQTKPSNHALQLPPMYLPEMTNKWVDMKLKHSHCQLVMCWLVEKAPFNLDTSALTMIRHLLESKHKHGLFDTLSEQRLVRAISLTGGIEQSDLEEIQLHITLSDAGARDKKRIMEIVAGYMEFLAKSQLAHWRFTELDKQNSLFTRYGNKTDPMATCINCAQALHDEALDLEQSVFSFQQAKNRISTILEKMSGKAHHIYSIDENAHANQVTDFYHVPYSLSDIPDEKAERGMNYMLAPQNTYLPAQLILVTPETSLGEIETIRKHGVVLKFSQVVKDEQPCGDCFISINSPAMCNNLANTMSKKVWVEGFTAYLQKRFYQADDAGVSFRVYGHQHGLTLHTTGFSEKQLQLCIEIINCMIAFRMHEDEFDQVKNAIIKRLSTRLLQKPINQLFATLNTMIQGDTHSIPQQVQAMQVLTFAELNEHQSEFFQENCVEALLVGNWRKHAAHKMHLQLQSRLAAKGVWRKPEIVAKTVPLACLPILPSTHASDTAVILYQQVRQLEPDFVYLREHATAICLILEHILGPYIFLRLRNDKQLAYLLGVGYKPINMQPGIVIYLQSSKANADVIYYAIIEVIDELLNNWETTAREIALSKHRVAEQCEPLNKDVSNIARRLWANYEHDDPFFHYQRLQQAIEQVDASEIKQWLEKMRTASEGQILLTNQSDVSDCASLSSFTHRPIVT